MPPLARPTRPRHQPTWRVCAAATDSTRARAAVAAAMAPRPKPMSVAMPRRPNATQSTTVPTPTHTGNGEPLPQHRAADLAPAEHRRHRHQEEQGQADRDGHGVEEGRADGDLLLGRPPRRAAGTPCRAARRRRSRRTATLLRRNAPSRPSGASMPPGERSRSPRQAMRPKPDDDHHEEEPDEQRPERRLREGVHRGDDARPGEEGAEDGERERGDRQREVPDPHEAAPLLDEHRVQVGGAAEPRQERGVLHRVPAPEAAPPEHLVRPPGAEHDADRQEGEGHQRPAPALDLPAVPHPSGGQHADGEGEGHGEADEADVEQRRVDGHQRVVLQQRVRPEALRRARRGDERVGRPDHQAEEEGGDDVEDERGPADHRVGGLAAGSATRRWSRRRRG